MTPQVSAEGLKQTKPWEYALRFAFGGAVTAAAGVVAHFYGPLVGGLFLAFPAILPASLTLMKNHAGRGAAVDDARGAFIGCAGLVAFAIVVALTAGSLSPWMVLTAATLAWVAASLVLWAAYSSLLRLAGPRRPP